jgi:iron complex transport system substrate-binding protein
MLNIRAMRFVAYGRLALGVALAVCGAAADAEIRLVDDSGQTVVLKAPAQRIISLAPHVTELLYTAGAGERIVGTVEYSNYPESAKKIARVGTNVQLDLERIVSLEPDLIVVWLHGSAHRQLDQLRKLGVPVFYNEPRRLEDIARSITQFGELAGTQAVAAQAARAFLTREAELRMRYAGRTPVRVFYQIWQKPLMTINGDHLISDVIRLCGGENVFADLKPLVPVISTEAVLQADPEAIGTAIIDGKAQDGLDSWKKWPQLSASARNNFFLIHTDLISRHTSRILEGAQQMCEHLDAARNHARERP